MVHKGTRVGEKKRAFFIDAIDCLAGVYDVEHLNHRNFLKTIRAAKTLL
jgi:hypothetical protein